MNILSTLLFHKPPQKTSRQSQIAKNIYSQDNNEMSESVSRTLCMKEIVCTKLNKKEQTNAIQTKKKTE